MGVAFGGGSQSSTSSSTQNQSKTFSAPQTALQDQAGGYLSSNLAASQDGTLSPGTQAQETASADQINKTAEGTQSVTQRYLASRGFGSSGQSGAATLSTELGRQSNLAANQSNFAGIQQNLNSSNLLAALNYSLTSLGTNATATGTSAGSEFGWGAEASVNGSSTSSTGSFGFGG